jgi:ribonucleoside-diphosphate reductase alpha chain
MVSIVEDVDQRFSIPEFFEKSGYQGYKIFIDRYTNKKRKGDVAVGDFAIVVTEKHPKFPKKELGYIVETDAKGAKVELYEDEGVIWQEYGLIDIPTERTPEEVGRRVAVAISSVEDASIREAVQAEFEEILIEYFIPGGRILAGAGTDGLTLINCFVIDNPEDSRRGVLESVIDMAEAHARGGGVGVNLSSLRPRYCHVLGVNGVSSGSISWGNLYNVETGLIEQGGSRRGATMLMMHDWHPDIFEFINAKAEPGSFENTNMSVCISDKFMDCLVTGKKWDLMFPETSHPVYDEEWDGDIWSWIDKGYPVRVYDSIDPTDIWNEIIQAAWASAEPGLHFLERSNKHSNTWYFAPLINTNPCVTGDTWVMTENGPRQVDDLVGVKTSLYVNGQLFKTESDGFFKTGHKEVFHIETSRGYSLKATKDHPVMTTSGWKEVGELSLKDDIILHYHSNISWDGDGSGISDKEDGYILGMLIGDGTFMGNRDRATICVWNDDGAIKDRIYNHAKTLQARADWRGWKEIPERGESRLNNIGVTNLARDFGVTADSKVITKEIEEASSNFYEGFLSGLFDADGHVEGTKDSGISIRLSTASYDTAIAVQRMLIRLGIFSSINRVDKTTDFGDSGFWRVIMTGANAKVFVDRCGFTHTEKRNKWNELTKDVSFYIPKITTSVSSIESLGYDFVYDVTVEQAHAFDANGLYVSNCGEQPLPAWGSCNLGAIDLSKVLQKNEDGDYYINYNKLSKTIVKSVRFLDNIIDLNKYHDPRIEAQHKSDRRIGLGTMGVGEMLIKLKLRYGSQESLDFLDQLYHFIATSAYLASSDLAVEKGSFPMFDPKKFFESEYMKKMPESVKETIRENGLRNAVLLTQAPNGTTGTMVGTTTGIEPDYALMRTRSSRLGTHTEVSHYIKELGLDIDNLPDYVVTAQDLAPEDHLAVQSTIQRWVDSAISKTTNVPADWTVEQVDELYRKAYDMGCKGVTIYRDGSRHEQVLTVIKNQQTQDNNCEVCGEILVKIDGCVSCLNGCFSKCDL